MACLAAGPWGHAPGAVVGQAMGHGGLTIKNDNDIICADRCHAGRLGAVFSALNWGLQDSMGMSIVQ
jgi:hypothetical protein